MHISHGEHIVPSNDVQLLIHLYPLPLSADVLWFALSFSENMSRYNTKNIPWKLMTKLICILIIRTQWEVIQRKCPSSSAWWTEHTLGACRLVRALTVCYELSGHTQRADRTTFGLVLWCTWLFIQLAQQRTERFILFISLWAQIIGCLFNSIFWHLCSSLWLRSPLLWV